MTSEELAAICERDAAWYGKPLRRRDTAALHAALDRRRLIAAVREADALRAASDPITEAAQRNDMGRVIALALSSQGYAQTDSEAVGLAFLRELEEQGYTLRLTTREERTERNSRGMSS